MQEAVLEGDREGRDGLRVGQGEYIADDGAEQGTLETGEQQKRIQTKMCMRGGRAQEGREGAEENKRAIEAHLDSNEEQGAWEAERQGGKENRPDGSEQDALGTGASRHSIGIFVNEGWGDEREQVDEREMRVHEDNRAEP